MSSPSDASDSGTGNPIDYENLDFTDSDFTFNDFTPPACSFYTDYRGKQIYRYDSGLLQLPVASETVDGSEECELVRVHAPIGQRVVQFTCENEGLPPKIPDALQDVGPNEKLITAVVTFDFPVPLTSGLGYAYRAHGEYTYASKKPWIPQGPTNASAASPSVIPNGGIGGDGTAFPMGIMPMIKSAVNATGNATGVTAFRTANFVSGEQTIVNGGNDDEAAVCPDVDTPPAEPATGSEAGIGPLDFEGERDPGNVGGGGEGPF